MAKGEILKGKKISRSKVLNKGKWRWNKSAYTLNITTHMVFSKIHLLSILKKEHGKFEKKHQRHFWVRKSNTSWKEEGEHEKETRC